MIYNLQLAFYQTSKNLSFVPVPIHFMSHSKLQIAVHFPVKISAQILHIVFFCACNKMHIFWVLRSSCAWVSWIPTECRISSPLVTLSSQNPPHTLQVRSVSSKYCCEVRHIVTPFALRCFWGSFTLLSISSFLSLSVDRFHFIHSAEFINPFSSS